MTKSTSVFVAAIIFVVAGIVLIYFLKLGKHSLSSSSRGAPVVITHDTMIPGKIVTTKQIIKIAGKGQFRKSANQGFGSKIAEDRQSTLEKLNDTVRHYTTTICDSGLTLALEISLPTDSIPPEVTYSGSYEQKTIEECDTLLRVVEKTFYEPSPWYNTFATGAVTAILALAILVLMLR